MFTDLVQSTVEFFCVNIVFEEQLRDTSLFLSSIGSLS